MQSFRFVNINRFQAVGRHQMFCSKLTHINYESNKPQMVDISEKVPTHRTAHAQVR